MRHYYNFSIVIPVKDEEGNLQELFQEIEETMLTVEGSWEAIFIDDGSQDSSLSILKEMASNKKNIKLLSFDKNHGQSSAFACGFAKSLGEFIITMDADRQNDPRDIPQLILAVQDCDLVTGWRVNRRDPLQKRWISKISNRIRKKLLKDGMHDSGCSLKIFRREAVDKIKLFEGMHRFLPALFLIEGYRVKEVPVRHRARERGVTKYHFFNRSIKPFCDLFAVAWMRNRHLNYQIKEELPLKKKTVK